MKKLLLASLLVLTYAGTWAQSFTLVNPVTNYYSSNTSQISQGFATIHNGSASAKDVMVERTANILAPGHTSYFCWDVCYGDAVDLSTGFLTVQSNADNSSFYCDVDPHGTAGIDTICFKFFDQNN